MQIKKNILQLLLDRYNYFKGGTAMRRQEIMTGYLFIAPFMLVFLVFLGFPILYSFYLSLHETSIYSDWYNIFADMNFVGFAHYAEFIFQDRNFWWSLISSLIYGILTIPTGIALSLITAVILTNKIRMVSFFRSSFFLPYVFDMFVVGVIWTFLYAPRYGLIDTILNNAFNITYFSETGLLGNPLFTLPFIALAIVLRNMGFGMILYLTTIQTIPPSIYQAAEVDGASWWQKLWHITVPLVKPITFLLIVMGVIAALNAFTEIYAMTENTGGPTIEFAEETVRVANLSGYFLYRNFEDGFYGRAAAISFILLVIGATISFAYYFLFTRKGENA